MPAEIKDQAKLPAFFVAFVNERQRPFRYVRKTDNNWDVYTWHGRWQFFDNVGNPTALMTYNDAVSVMVEAA